MDKKTKSVFIRLSPEDYAIIQQGAEADRRKMAEFMRVYALRVAGDLIKRKNEVTVLDALAKLNQQGVFSVAEPRPVDNTPDLFGGIGQGGSNA